MPDKYVIRAKRPGEILGHTAECITSGNALYFFNGFARMHGIDTVTVEVVDGDKYRVIPPIRLRKTAGTERNCRRCELVDFDRMTSDEESKME